MAITFPCGCGKTLRVADALAGRRVRCPACKAELAVPAIDDAAGFEVIDDAPPPRPKPAAAKPVVAKRVAKPPADDAGFEVVEDEPPKAYGMKPADATRPPPPRPRRPRDEYDDEDDDRPVRRKKRKPPASNPFSTRNLTIGFGAVMILAGIVVAVVYWNSDAEVTGRRGRKTSAATFGIVIAVGGLFTSGRGAMMSDDDDE